jgi:hypothetical protein
MPRRVSAAIPLVPTDFAVRDYYSTPSTMKRPIAVMILPRRQVISCEQKVAAAVPFELVERTTTRLFVAVGSLSTQIAIP